MRISGPKLSIRSQLYGSAVVTTVMLALLVGVAAHHLRQLSSETTRLSQDTLAFMTLTTAAEKASAVMRMPGDAAGGRGVTRDAYVVRHDDLAGDLVRLRDGAAPASQKTYDTAMAALKAVDAEARLLFGHLEAGRADDASTQALVIEELSSEFLAAVRKLSLDSKVALQARLEGVEDRAKAPLRGLIITSAVLIVLSLVVSVFIVRSIRPLALTAQILAKAADELKDVAEGLGAHASEVADKARALSVGSEQVRSNLVELSTAANGINASIEKIGRTAHSAAAVATDASTASQGTSTTVARLQVSGREIDAVVKTINSLALQTNLLALNAAIEAARAGDAGAGFAVVADEVKALAGATSGATDNIVAAVEVIQTNTEAAVLSISDVCRVIQEIRNGQASIAAAVEEQTAVTLSVSQRLADSARVTELIASDVSAVASAAEATSTNASETRRLADHLSQTAVDLHACVAAFRV
jgi:methyl-accepting chemotaxis protein